MLEQEILIPKRWETEKCMYPFMLKYNRKYDIVENVWPVNLDVSTDNVETV